MENRKSKHVIRRISSFKTETLQSYQKSYNEWVILKFFFNYSFHNFNQKSDVKSFLSPKNCSLTGRLSMSCNDLNVIQVF